MVHGTRHIDAFWESIWEYVDVISHTPYTTLFWGLPVTCRAPEWFAKALHSIMLNTSLEERLRRAGLPYTLFEKDKEVQAISMG